MGRGTHRCGLKQTGPWTVGGLANHVWSVAGDNSRADINATFLQPFVSYTTSKATSITLNTESTYDWGADEWSVPVNLQINQMVKLGHQPAQIGIGARYWLDAPNGGPDGWGGRLNLVLLFPK